MRLYLGDEAEVRFGMNLETAPSPVVLATTDGSLPSRRGVDRAAELARSTGARLLVLGVELPADAREVFGRWEGIDIDSLVGELAHRYPGLDVSGTVEVGDPARTICSVAEREQASLVVVGNRRMNGLGRVLLGSVGRVVLKRSRRPVVVVDTGAGTAAA